MSLISHKDLTLISALKNILSTENLALLRENVSELNAELGTDSTSLATALLRLIQNTAQPPLNAIKDKKPKTEAHHSNTQLLIKMVRYRLNIGSDHSINAEQIRETLIEESGVDKKNINNINIQRTYTLIELPDEMPPDIFQHLKSVEINQLKLDIKRVKPRNNKKRGNNHFRRNRRPEHTTELNKSTIQQ